MASKEPEIIEEVLRSDLLYRGEVRVTEVKTPGFANLRSGRQIKDLLQPVFFWFLKNAPSALAILPFRLLAGIARLLYRVPGNPLRQSCADVCQLAASHGHRHEPKTVYRQYLRNLVSAGYGYQLLLRGGAPAVFDRVDFGEDCQRKAREAMESYGGVLIACPHNLGSAFSAVKMNQCFPVVAVMKNSATIRRTRQALEAFERMQVRIIMVRSGNPFELSRALFAVLKEGNVVAATVDNIDISPGAVTAPWAAKIAAKKGAPLVPSFYHSKGERIVAVWGEPLVTNDLQEALQHYVSFFEAKILEDPASWAYLADRKWRRALRRAVEAQSSSST